jgi:hypothetical protein
MVPQKRNSDLEENLLQELQSHGDIVCTHMMAAAHYSFQISIQYQASSSCFQSHRGLELSDVTGYRVQF